jgi:hypothetical protein
VHHPLRVGDHGIGEGPQPPVLEVQDPVGDVEDPVVVRDQQDRRAPLAGECLHAIDDLATGGLVERRRGFVREHHGRLADERAGDRDALALAARELLGPLVRVRAEAHGLEHRFRPSPQLRACGAARHAQAELHVLGRRECTEQVVLLEDEADVAAHVLERRALPAAELVAEHAQPALLRRSQRTDQREQRRLAGA